MNLLRFHNYENKKEVWINPKDISSVGERRVPCGLWTKEQAEKNKNDEENFQWPETVCIMMKSDNCHFITESMDEVVQILDTSGMAKRDGVIRA